MGGRDTSLLRPAIEDHQQNHDWREPYNRFVEGSATVCWPGWRSTRMRLDLMSKVFWNPARKSLSASRSISWISGSTALRDLVPKAISPAMFDAAHRHELHHFLEHHFQHLTAEERRRKSWTSFGTCRLPDRGEQFRTDTPPPAGRWLTSDCRKGL